MLERMLIPLAMLIAFVLAFVIMLRLEKRRVQKKIKEKHLFCLDSLFAMYPPDIIPRVTEYPEFIKVCKNTFGSRGLTRIYLTKNDFRWLIDSLMMHGHRMWLNWLSERFKVEQIDLSKCWVSFEIDSQGNGRLIKL